MDGYRQGGYGLWIDPSTDNGDKQGHIKDYSVSDMWSTWKWYINHYAPYQIGDILYVRETWARLVTAKDGEMQSERYVYKATDEYPFGESGYIVKFRWKPSIHMPKEAARIWLKVTDVRVERLQEIDGIGAEKEGMDSDMPITNFIQVWNSTINKKDLDRYGWDANPWVWVIEFERIER